MARRTGVAIALVLALAGCGHGGDTIPEDRLSGLVLQPRDLPAGFEIFDRGPQVRLDNQGTTRVNPSRFGRTGGWKARYRRAGGTETAGPLIVESRADLFGSSGDARKDLELYGADLGKTLRSARGRRLQPPAIGDDAVGITFVQPGLKPLRFYRIVWRDRNATASLLVQGFDGHITGAEAMRLARRQEARIRRAAD